MTRISDAGLDRRQMLRRAVWLAGGVAAVSAFGEGKAFAQARTPFFDGGHRAILDAVSDIIIPATDTPGARDAGVPAFLDAMMANWASGATRLQLPNVLHPVDARARVETGLPFLQLPPERR